MEATSKEGEGNCLKCGYPISGSSDRCPECGLPVDSAKGLSIVVRENASLLRGLTITYLGCMAMLILCIAVVLLSFYESYFGSRPGQAEYIVLPALLASIASVFVGCIVGSHGLSTLSRLGGHSTLIICLRSVAVFGIATVPAMEIARRIMLWKQVSAFGAIVVWSVFSLSASLSLIMTLFLFLRGIVILPQLMGETDTVLKTYRVTSSFLVIALSNVLVLSVLLLAEVFGKTYIYSVTQCVLPITVLALACVFFMVTLTLGRLRERIIAAKGPYLLC